MQFRTWGFIGRTSLLAARASVSCRRLSALGSCVLLLLAAALTARAEEQAKPARPDADTIYRSEIVPFLTKFCLDCHSESPEGDVSFHQFKDALSIANDQHTWERAIKMLRSGAMPPEDMDQPSDAERKKIVHWLEETVYNFNCDDLATIDPGRVTIRRLNRAEYNNTVRDLLGVTFKPANDFPSDDVGGGFDNLGDVLTVPPLLLEKYLAAAERIAEESIIGDLKVFIESRYRDRNNLRGDGTASYDNERRRWSLDGEGSVWAEVDLPREGEYQIRVYARRQPGPGRPAKIELRLGDKTLESFDIAETDRTGKFEVTADGSRGRQRVSVRLVMPDDGSDSEAQRVRGVNIQAFEVDGPVDIRPQDLPEAHRKLITVRPGKGRSVGDAAKANLKPFLDRAFRRPATDDEVARFTAAVEEAVSEGDTFEQGMQIAVTAALVSPHFLFRAEIAPQQGESGGIYELNDYQLASRLSYFIWSSMPDEELFSLAAEGQLRKPEVREQQIRRMLADEKSDALVENFVAQWLNLRLLEDVTPDPRAFPKFDADLKAAMQRETELFATAIIREDRSVLDFLEGRYTFVNARLARHYGMKDVWGAEFRRVELAGDQRTGVLTHASILTLTSNPGRTSPVKRGKWILENILGSPPPDPPPDVPDLEATQKLQPELSLRKQLEIHRTNAVCASCHKVMDQLGFGLENFDAVGRWRDEDGKFPVDASGELPSGGSFSGPLELAGVITEQRNEFVRCLAEKMMIFALGRELRVQDRCAVDKIVESVEKQDYRFSALVTAIAESEPFRKRRGDGGTP